MPLDLPNSFDIELPNLRELSEGAIGSPESGFAPGTTIARTSDDARKEHALIYREQMNTIENLKDGVRLVNNIVSTGVEYTVLGQSILKYQTGLEKMRNEGVKLQKAQTQTAISSAELEQLRLKLNFETSKLPILESGYQHKLEGLRVQADIAYRETQDAIRDRDTRYPLIDVQAIQSAA